MIRIGHGYDAHRFASGRSLILGGVKIPYEADGKPCGLDGHSDADVLVHALIDALLGAAGMPDIGAFFPPGDPATEGISSVILLIRVMNKLRKKGVRVINADCTIVAQSPRLAEYIPTMSRVLSRVVNAPVNVKATTEEKMGFTGRREGIASHAVTLLREAKQLIVNNDA
ncbi:2-C-methyl-D-erythritol 2,4-cyclodiphosphate synthase [Clostridia bacterium]|nr:2-C-methyl-D-erythritol 2,4-cyclodiphosphate synthase [Clostridia bacterium]